MSDFVLGIDIGGTFTDAVLVDVASGAVVDVLKLFTTPAEPELAAQSALEWARERAGRGATVDVHHGTTLVTNMLLEGRWSRAGMLATAGFRDVIELNRQVRPDPFDLFFQRPAALVPRSLRRGVRERVGADGAIVEPLDEDAALRELDELVRDEGVEALAICFVNSYANPVHELRMAELARGAWPDLPVVASAELLPRRGEFARFMTASVNAATLPRFQAYLDRLGGAVETAGDGGRLYMMQSTGQLTTRSHARARSVDYCESGPAAGVVGGVTLTRTRDGVAAEHLLTLDVGGTTAKVSTAWAGQIDITHSYSVGGAIHGRTLGAASSGYTVAVPVVDMVEVGAGGGSLVWVDAGGALRVGPKSAGADPGPVCYGRGGTQPTLTDALVVAGVLSGEQLLGGGLAVDRDAAHAALEAVGAEIGEDALGVAVGAVEVAVAGMRAAVRTVTVERGYDPADLALMACGGLGPTFAGLLAPVLGVASILVPERAGVFSAWGLNLAPLGATVTASLPTAGSWERLQEEVARLDADVRETIASMNGTSGARHVRRYVEMRYPGQSSTIEVGLEGADDPARLQAEFARLHEERYGFRRDDIAAELVGVRVNGSLPPRVGTPTAAALDPIERIGTRAVHVFDGARELAVYRQRGEGRLARTAGPFAIERYDSTVLVPPGWVGETDGPFLRVAPAQDSK